jgi:hypothetical protein
MAKRRSKEDNERRRLLAEGYSECKDCGKLIKPRAWRCSECGTSTAIYKKMVWGIVVIALLLVASVAAYAYYPRSEPYVSPPTVILAEPAGYGASTSDQIRVTFNKLMDESSVESSFQILPQIGGSFSWNGICVTFTPSVPLAADTYYTGYIGSGTRDRSGLPLDCGMYSWSFSTASPPSTRRDVGTGADDFWIEYPSTHPSSGGAVQHPEWVLSALDSGVVMILDHSEGCAPCIRQGTICLSISSANPDITYIDLSSGTDEPDASEGFAAYDPNGGVHYVPLTIVVTRVQSPTGGTAIGWHAWEGVIDESSLQSWIADAKSHFSENG